MDNINSRGQAMEDAFFANRDKALLEKLRSEMGGQDDSDKLKAVSGIEDDAVLGMLKEHGITSETLASVSLIPLVAVAWSDGVMEDAERTAILKAADASGIASATAAYGILESWLDTKPDAGLLDSWKGYVGELVTKLDGAAVTQLKIGVLKRAKGVAEAAGGFLGLGNKVSASEQSVLDELEKAFG